MSIYIGENGERQVRVATLDGRVAVKPAWPPSCDAPGCHEGLMRPVGAWGPFPAGLTERHDMAMSSCRIVAVNAPGHPPMLGWCGGGPGDRGPSVGWLPADWRWLCWPCFAEAYEYLLPPEYRQPEFALEVPLAEAEAAARAAFERTMANLDAAIRRAGMPRAPQRDA